MIANGKNFIGLFPAIFTPGYNYSTLNLAYSIATGYDVALLVCVWVWINVVGSP